MKFRLTIIFLFQFLLFFVFVPKAQAWWLVDQFGRLIKMDSNGEVLGDEDLGQQTTGKNEIRSETKTEIKNEEKKTEIKSTDGVRERFEFKPGENKREFENARFKIKLEQKDGQLKMKTKNELTGEETEIETRTENKERPEKIEPREPRELKEPQENESEIEDETEIEVLKIKDREDRNEIKVNTRNGEFVIDRNRVGATTNFPLSVDSSTNILTVTTPAGEKQVTILPDQAVQNMLSRNVIDQISGQSADNLTSRVKMSQKSDGSLVYEVEGEKLEKLFGLMPLKFKKTAIVSVETGELLETKESFASRLLGLISF